MNDIKGNTRNILSNNTVDGAFCSLIELKLFESQINNFSITLKINIANDILDSLETFFPNSIIKSREYFKYIINLNDIIKIHIWAGSVCKVTIVGSKEFVHETKQWFENNSEPVKSTINWVYSADGSTMEMELNISTLPETIHYPWLNGKQLDSFYTEFCKSNSNVLILQGAPGTGKTTFIKGLINSELTNAHVVYDPVVMESDIAFMRWFKASDSKFLVLEDADHLINSRERGNSLMHRILNLSDGIMSISQKKIIFSTNLPNIKDIDLALTRPGRCFGVINFTKFTPEQAKQLAKDKNLKLANLDQKDYTLAEIYNDSISLGNAKEFGFNQ